MYLACTWQEAQKHHSKRKLKTTIREGVTYLNQYLGSQGKSVCLRCMFTYVCICVFRHTQHTHLFGLFFDFFDFFDWATGTSSSSSSIGRLELWTRPMKAMSSRILFHQKRKLRTTIGVHHWGQRLNIHEIHEKCPSPKDESKDISAPLSSK